MKKAIIFLTDGFEEIEAVVPADILRRAGIKVIFMSITGTLEVMGALNIKIVADSIFDGTAEADMLILPGGTGAKKFLENKALAGVLTEHNDKNGYIAAICAAPLTLGKLNILKDKAATCFPALVDLLNAAEYKTDAVIIDNNIITARAAGASAEFGLALVEILLGAEKAQSVKETMYL